MNATHDLEERLSAAFRARAEQVRPELLTPRTAPAAGRAPRRRGLVAVGAAAAAAVVAAVAITGIGGDDPRGGTTPLARGVTTPGPLVDLFREDPLRALDSPTTTYADGGVGRLDGDLLVVTEGGREWRGDVSEWVTAPLLTGVSVDLGGGRWAYVVVDADPVDQEFVVLTRWHDRLVPVRWPVEHLPRGGPRMTGFETWVSADGGLYSRTYSPRSNLTSVFRRSFPDPAAIDPDATSIDLRATPLGRFCLDPTADEPPTYC